MGIAAGDVVSLSQGRSHLSELADQARSGSEKIITKNGESYVALIDSSRLDYFHSLEAERIHLLVIDDVAKGLDDVESGRTKEAGKVLKAFAKRRAAASR